MRRYRAIIRCTVGHHRLEFIFNAESWTRAEVVARVFAETLTNARMVLGDFFVCSLGDLGPCPD